MKRTPMPQRTAALLTRAPLTRGTGLTRTATLPRTTTPSPRRRSTGTAIDVAMLVRARDNGCVGCGRVDVRLEVHHRHAKGMGGSRLLDVLSNLVALCGWGNTTGCHGWAHQHPALARPAGLVVPRGSDWRPIPVRGHNGRWWLLDDAGHRHPCEAPA